jgi:hypothetical protein
VKYSTDTNSTPSLLGVFHGNYLFFSIFVMSGVAAVKKFLIALCAVASFAASAEWVFISKNESGTSLYIDPNIKI